MTHALDHHSTLSSPFSSIHQSKSFPYFDSSTTNLRRSFDLITNANDLETSKEGILYCKTVLIEGRRAGDRSWHGTWAILRRAALFLGKEKKHGLLIPLSCDSFPINLQNASVQLASDYIKKPRVFKLITSNQSEFLFQAPDLRALAEWLELIKRNSTVFKFEQYNQRLTNQNQEKSEKVTNSSLSLITSNHHANSEQE